jgi:hypothetical protein
MISNAHDADEPDGAASLADRLAADLTRSFTVGTDGDGMTHHYYRPADTVVVYDPDGDTGVDHHHYLDGTPLDEWVRYVATQRGWQTTGHHAAHGIREDSRRKEANR